MQNIACTYSVYFTNKTFDRTAVKKEKVKDGLHLALKESSLIFDPL